MKLTPATEALLIKISEAAEMSNDGLGAWGSWFEPTTKEQRGNIADLIKKGLLTVNEPESDGEIWYQLTSVAKEIAQTKKENQ